MRILILGGDGYLGWPQALYLSKKGHEIAILDNFMRRNADNEFGFNSLVPIFPLYERVNAWMGETGKEIQVFVGDTLVYEDLEKAFGDFAPEAVIHFAEQRTAPYSMIDRKHAFFTQYNNVLGTLNVLYAIKEFAPDCHLVKLGTMGEYGTPNIDIEEGFIEIEHNGRKDILPFPKQPGSFYHLSKVHDSNNIMFCCKTWGIRATDLNQGIVYGVQTEDTALNPKLYTRYDYDQIYGTVLNRFCCQAVIGHPLTIYGSGGQTRGLINIKDTIRCIEIALENPPKMGNFQVFNQVTEQYSIIELANMVKELGHQLDFNVKIQHIPNPRVEKENHYYNAKFTKLIDLGLEPYLLQDRELIEIIETATKHKSQINKGVIAPSVKWRDTSNKVSNIENLESDDSSK